MKTKHIRPSTVINTKFGDFTVESNGSRHPKLELCKCDSEQHIKWKQPNTPKNNHYLVGRVVHGDLLCYQVNIYKGRFMLFLGNKIKRNAQNKLSPTLKEKIKTKPSKYIIERFNNAQVIVYNLEKQFTFAISLDSNSDCLDSEQNVYLNSDILEWLQ